MDENSLLFLFAGFIDGDGCVSKQTNRKDASLKIQCHGSWLRFLNLLSSSVYSKFNENDKYQPPLAKINKKGYAYLNITNNSILREFKKFIKTEQLPFLTRKWEVIDENTISRNLTSDYKKQKILELKKIGYSVRSIKEQLEVSDSYVSMVINGKR